MKKVRFLIGIKFPVLGKDIVMCYEESFNVNIATQNIFDKINEYVEEKLRQNYFRTKWEYSFISQINL